MGELKIEKPTKKAPIRLLYDFWETEEIRHAAGAVVELPTEQARELVKAGKAERADPMPGED